MLNFFRFLSERGRHNVGILGGCIGVVMVISLTGEEMAGLITCVTGEEVLVGGYLGGHH